MFDKNARPVMHAFEGTGDTIQDAVVEEEEPIVPIYVMEPSDTLVSDTLQTDGMQDSLMVDGEAVDFVPNDTNSIQSTTIQ